MKAVKKTAVRRSPFQKWMFIFFLLLLILSFFLQVKLGAGSKPDQVQLSEDDQILMPQSTTKGAFFLSATYFSFDLSDSNDSIFYTTDGTSPDRNSRLYQHAFLISDRSTEKNDLSEIPTSPRWLPPIDNVPKATVIRAIRVGEGNKKSPEFVRTVFIANHQTGLPVVALTVKRKDLFGHNFGIYILGKSYGDKNNYAEKDVHLDLPWWEYPANYQERGNDAERDCHIEFYDLQNKTGFSVNAGLRIHGNATRGYAQKSLRVCFKKKYGPEPLNFKMFEENPVQAFNSLILRNSGNDWDKTMFRDAFMQSLMKGTILDIQDYRPCVVFINGEYWGIHNIRERFDEHYIVNKYGIDKGEISILELSGLVAYGNKKNADDFKGLLNFIKKNDLTKKENYDYVAGKIDLKSFNDFLIANLYFCNGDWPNNNVRFWRTEHADQDDSTGFRDGRWRWMLYDMDWGCGYNAISSADGNLLKKASRTGSVGILFSNLIKNEDYRKLFLERFRELMETRFSPENCRKVIDKMSDEIAGEIPEHINRWRAIGSFEKWRKNVQDMIDFTERRPAFQAQQLNEFFKLQGPSRFSAEISRKPH